jgi:hypothetical protein
MMIADRQSHADVPVDAASGERPRITICEGCPGRTVFIEDENTDGWIASDHIVDITR